MPAKRARSSWARCATRKTPNFGYNALTDEYEDLVKAGVHRSDQGRAHRAQNAGSIASLMLTTEALVSEIPEEKKAPAGGMGDMY